MPAIHPPDLLALIRAAKEAPDEAGPRQVLADWLEEHGEADRADCVRLSLRLAAVAEHLFWRWDDPRRAGWRAALDDPRREAGRWLAPLRAIFPRTDFHAGLLRVRTTAEELL